MDDDVRVIVRLLHARGMLDPDTALAIIESPDRYRGEASHARAELHDPGTCMVCAACPECAGRRWADGTVCDCPAGRWREVRP